jgi:group I intron endonuclease
MNVYSIYKVTNKINGKVYIGFTSLLLDTRKSKHLQNSKRKFVSKLYNSIRKYGEDNFTWEIIYQSLEGEHTLNVMENYFILEHDSFNNGLNSTLGGDGVPGRTKSKEEIESHREKMTGRTVPREVIERISKSNTGKKRSDETKRRLIASHIGIKDSDETKKKKSKSARKPKSKEHAENISKSKIGILNPSFKGFYVDSEGNKFTSAIQASNFHNIGETTVRRWVKNNKNGWYFLSK